MLRFLNPDTIKFIHERGRISSFVLLIGLVLMVFSWSMQFFPNYFSITTSTQSWWRDSLLNIGTGLITSVAFVWLYDAALKRKEMKRLAAQKKALAHNLRFPLVEHFELLIDLYLASLPPLSDDALKKEPSSFDEVFSEDYFQTIRHIDLRTPITNHSFLEYWPEKIESCCKSLSEAINFAVLSGANCLDPEEIEPFLAIQGSFFMRSVHVLQRDVLLITIYEENNVIQKTRNGLIPEGKDLFFKEFEKHVKFFQRLLEWCNQVSEKKLIAPESWKNYGSVEPASSRSTVL